MDDHKAPILTASFDNSTNLKAAEYDPFMHVLSLTFKNGLTYDFLCVEQTLFEELIAAESAGRFFHLKIKGKYEFLKKPKTEKKSLNASRSLSEEEKDKIK